MPVHDWSPVEAGIFHDLHVAWIPGLRTALNAGLLPEGFYALAEQHSGRAIADVLTLHASPAPSEPFSLPPLPGGTAVAEAPPQVPGLLSARRHAGYNRGGTGCFLREEGLRWPSLSKLPMKAAC